MRLDRILDGVEVLESDLKKDFEVLSEKVTHKEKEAHEAVLVLVKNEFDEKAVNESNAVFVVAEKRTNVRLPQIVVKNARSAYALIAKHLHNDACDKLNVVMVSGTNGKSSTTDYTCQILDLCGIKTAEITTSGCRFEDYFYDSSMTTPDPDVLHGLFEVFLTLGAEAVVMEASAHALELCKLDGIMASVGVFTNLSQDHLDFFENMESYKWAKFKLFSHVKFACFNVDDEVGREFSESVLLPMQTYGIDTSADFTASEVSDDGLLSFKLEEGEERFDVLTNLYGKFNVYNLLASFCVAKIFGIETSATVAAAKKIVALKGRFQVIESDLGKVVIDYAHTPKALENAVLTAKRIAEKRVITVFGCGGDRDKGKRKLMGETATTLSDLTIITSDNPRFEEPYEIIRDVEEGAKKGKSKYLTVEGRSSAIDFALFEMKKGDVVLICGKGAEEYNDVKGIKYPYSDEKTVRAILFES